MIRNFMLYSLLSIFFKAQDNLKPLLPVLSIQWGFNQILGIRQAPSKTIRIFLSSILLNTSQTFNEPWKFQLSCVSLIPKLPGKKYLCAHVLSIYTSPFYLICQNQPGKAERWVGIVGQFLCPSFFTPHRGRSCVRPLLRVWLSHLRVYQNHLEGFFSFLKVNFFFFNPESLKKIYLCIWLWQVLVAARGILLG